MISTVTLHVYPHGGAPVQALTRTPFLSSIVQFVPAFFRDLAEALADDPLEVACFSLNRPCKTARQGNDVLVT